jgi:hypothetical protein
VDRWHWQGWKYLAALAHALAFHAGYLFYIHPMFEYAHYNYYPVALLQLLLTYGFILVPLVGYRFSAAPAAYGAALIYALCYVPAQLVVLFNWNRGEPELLAMQASLAGSMLCLFLSAPLGWRTVSTMATERRIRPWVAALTFISIGILIFAYGSHMRIVSFADVYDLRSQTNQVQLGALSLYLLSWLSYCFLPFFFARGILRRSPADVSIGLIGCVLIYASSGSKAAILLPFIMLGMVWLINAGSQFLLKLLVVLACATYFVTMILPLEFPWIWAKSILLVRLLGTGGWTISVYYEHFTRHGLTYYSHIGPVNTVTQAYPYDDLLLGQVIGLEYSGTEAANFNANFWASDGFAALGLAGIPVVTFFLVIVFFAINRASLGYSSKFVVLWLAGFWLALLNIPLSTALLSAGGGVTLFLLWIAKQRFRRMKPIRAANFPLTQGGAGVNGAKQEST